VGPRFSGKVREEPQRRERWWEDQESKTSEIRKPRRSGPVMEAMKKAEFLSPHPFQPSRREKIKTRRLRQFA